MRLFLCITASWLLIIICTLDSPKTANAECSNYLVCLNNGAFNNQTCRCECFPTYSGERCENLNCAIVDPQDCFGRFRPLCSLPLIRSYCPSNCGLCPNAITSSTPTGTSTSTSSSTCATTTSASWCAFIKQSTFSQFCSSESALQTSCQTFCRCLNYGEFNTTTCSCKCLTPWSGSNCTVTDCSLPEPEPCKNSAISSSCNDPNVVYLCPKTCKLACLTSS